MIEQPLARAGTLKRRLSDAEATITALLSEQIDAIVDPSSNTPLLLSKAQDALRESETRYHDERDRAQRYLDTAAVVLLALDTRERITLINRHACTVLGWTASELMGKSWIDTCVPERLRAGIRARFNEVVAGDLSAVEAPMMTRSGEERLMEWKNILVHDDHGTVTGTFSSGTDITERTRALETIREAEERTRFALKAAKIGIWDMDYVTGKLEWSDVLQAQYGMEPGSFSGDFESFVGSIHPDDRESTVATIGAAMKSGADFVTNNRSVGPDGKVRWLRGAGRVQLDASGNAVRGNGISQDVTEMRALEQQFLQAQKMEAVGRLASGVAHDFNNLLSVILGWSNMALDELPAEHPVREALDEVIKAGEGAAGLTKQLLAFSRQQLVEPTLFNPNDVVIAADKMLQRLVGENIDLVTRTAPDVGTLKMDRGQLEQVLMNLVVNARDAMPLGGRLTIETANVVLDDEFPVGTPDLMPGEYVLLAVSDTGTGMTDEVKAKLFEPFFTTKDRDKGTGLGLATSYGVVKQAGGHIGVYSEVGVGTTMKVYLPLRHEAASKTGPNPGTLHGDESILLVEDDAAVRRVTTRMLKAQGYRVLPCSNADDALDVINAGREKIDLLLTDVVLARGISGRVLAERVAVLRPDLPVLFASGYTNDVTILHGMLDAGVSLVQKPFTAYMLGRKVRDALDGD